MSGCTCVLKALSCQQWSDGEISHKQLLCVPNRLTGSATQELACIKATGGWCILSISVSLCLFLSVPLDFPFSSSIMSGVFLQAVILRENGFLKSNIPQSSQINPPQPPNPPTPCLHIVQQPHGLAVPYSRRTLKDIMIISPYTRPCQPTPNRHHAELTTQSLQCALTLGCCKGTEISFNMAGM